MNIAFESLQIIEPIRRALEQIGYKEATSIQAHAIPLILDNKDILAISETGTGKTAAFCIPILQRSIYKQENRRGKRKLKALFLAPTREIALQIGEQLVMIGKHIELKNLVVFGGVNQGKQADVLHNGVDILVATPGRFLDLFKQKLIAVNTIQTLVIDEADRMLRLGFEKEVKQILEILPPARQSLLFSATMSEQIQLLSKSVLRKPIIVNCSNEQVVPQNLEQKIFFIEPDKKKAFLTNTLKENNFNKVLIFAPTILEVKEITNDLLLLKINAAAIHREKSQNTRIKTLTDFKNGTINVLVGTDVLARGIDVEDIDIVINYDIPKIPEIYIHRIGRTARAGKLGKAISFCSEAEKERLKAIELLLGYEIERN